MLFDYLFLTAIGLDWLILGLVVFGSKALLNPLPETGKNIFRKSFTGIVLVFLLFLFIVKISFVILIGLPLKNLIAPAPFSRFVLFFALIQLLFAFTLLILSMLILVKSGLNDEFQPVWSKRISYGLIVSLFADFLLVVSFYFWFIKSLFQTDLIAGSLALVYQPIAATHYWLALGLILALIVYFIFYLALKHRNSATTITGMSLSYLIILLFAGLLAYYCRSLIAPNARYLINGFSLYLVFILWISILFLGIASLLLILIIYRKRKFLKNEFYFRYILIRLGGFHAVNVVGLSVISLVPIVFFTLYR